MGKRTKIRFKDALMMVLTMMSFIIFPGCQKVINVDLNVAAPKIVIEGLITDRRGPYSVSITKSGRYPERSSSGYLCYFQNQGNSRKNIYAECNF